MLASAHASLYHWGRFEGVRPESSRPGSLARAHACMPTLGQALTPLPTTRGGTSRSRALGAGERLGPRGRARGVGDGRRRWRATSMPAERLEAEARTRAQPSPTPRTGGRRDRPRDAPRRTDRSDGLGLVDVAAQRVDGAQLLGVWTSATVEQRAADDDRHRPGARDRHVEPVQVVEERDAAGREGRRGARHRVDDDGALLALELVDRADPSAVRQRGASVATCAL